MVTKGHWTAETLRTTDKYPLSAQLLARAPPEVGEMRDSKHERQTAGKAKRKLALTMRHARTQIVSPELCGTSSPSPASRWLRVRVRVGRC